MEEYILKMIIYYDIIENYGKLEILTAENAFEFKSNGIIRIDINIVTEIANDFYNNHDGWEYDIESWPLTFRIWNDNGEHVNDYLVYLEFEPVFDATLIPKKDKQ